MKKIVMLILLISIYLGANAQWKSFPTNAKVVNQVFEDSKGNIWFFNKENMQKSCLVKYDGTKVENIKSLDKAKTICIFNMLEGPGGKLYAATFFGLAICDGGNWTVMDKKDGLPGNVVREILFDKKGDLWIFPAVGFNKGQAGKLVNGNYEPVQMNGHTGKAIRAVLEDKDGEIWTGMHLANVAKFDGTKWTDYTGISKCKHVSRIAQDDKGRIWIAGLEGQFACFDNGKWNSFKHGSGYFSPYSAPLMIIGILPGVIAGYAGPDITSWGDLVVDKNSEAWMLARKKGVVVSDGKDYQTSEKKYNAPKTKKVTDIMADSKGNIWMALATGEVYKYDFTSWKVYTQKDGLPSNLSAIFEAKNGDIWVAGKKSIAVLKN